MIMASILLLKGRLALPWAFAVKQGLAYGVLHPKQGMQFHNNLQSRLCFRARSPNYTVGC